MMTLDAALTALIYLAECFVLFIIGRFAYKLFQKKIKVGKELVERDNFAFADRYCCCFSFCANFIRSPALPDNRGSRHRISTYRYQLPKNQAHLGDLCLCTGSHRSDY